MNFTCAVVAQITVQLRQGFLIVPFAIAVNNVQSLSRVCVEEMQAVRRVRNDLSCWLDGMRNPPEEDQQQQNEMTTTLQRTDQDKTLRK